ncbi:Fungal transcriptional regulatory protein, partial [Scheffersomyces stipitis CBS 6054]
ARKRNRITLVCNVCKFRKVKCDRGQPCSSCTKYNTSHICAYNKPYYGDASVDVVNVEPDVSQKNSLSESSSVNSAQTASGIVDSPNSGPSSTSTSSTSVSAISANQPAMIGINPVSSPSDTINFFDYPPISTTPDKYEVNHGPFTWHAFLKMDMGLSDLWAFMSTKSQSFHEAKTKFMDCVPPGKNKESSRSFENQSVLNKTPIQVLQRLNIAAKKKFNTSKHNINEGIPLGLNFITDHEYLNNNDIELSSKILTVLPSKRIVWIHINRFFKFIYPYIPFLDETSFKKSIEAIIGPESFTEEKIEGLKIEDNIDYAKLGIMLIILRMSYLSLITNNQEVNEFFLGYDGQKRNTFYKEKQKLTDSELRSLKMLLLNSIGIDVIVLARNCLNKFQLFQKMNLSILQLALFMRIYVFIAPEDSEGPDRNQFQIYNGTLLSMAYSIGLNREPDSFKSVLNDPKENNIRRKIWFHLNYIDLLHGFSSGNPLTTNPIASDVKFPFHEDGNENISFEALDSYTHVAWKFLQPLSTKMRNILNIVGNVSEGVKIIELVEALNDFEIFVATNLGTHISEFIDAFKEDFFNDNFRRVLQVHYYIQVKFFMVSIYHHLFIHYETEKNQELSFFYLKKMLMVLTEEFLPSYYTILEHEHYYFSYSANLFLNPVIESAMHKSNGILFSLIIRMSYTIRAMEGANPSAHVEKMATDESYKSYFDDMSQLQYYLTKCAKLGTLGISKLGNRYLYAWRISKSNLFILRAISSDEFY